jgi:hypothetical protein
MAKTQIIDLSLPGLPITNAYAYVLLTCAGTYYHRRDCRIYNRSLAIVIIADHHFLDF